MELSEVTLPPGWEGRVRTIGTEAVGGHSILVHCPEIHDLCASKMLARRGKDIAFVRDLGEQLVAWRKLQRLTQAIVAERAYISRTTLRKLEQGDSSVGMEHFLDVLRALGCLKYLLDGLDPFDTPVGRHCAIEQLPERVRTP